MSSNKRLTKKKKNKRIFFVILTVLFIISIYNFTRFFLLYKSGGVSNINKSAEINVSIEKGATLKEIANTLEENKVISSSFFFVLKCKQLEVGQDFKYGDFTFNTNMTFYEIVEELKTPNKSTSYAVLLVKEGDTREDIANNLQDLGVVTYDEFINACDTLELQFDFFKSMPNRENRLEGYLYPDTYYIDFDESPEEIITRLVSRFNEFLTEDLKQRASQMNLTIDEVVIMASIIEKEIKVSSEKEIAASVIYNRLKNNMKLQMDSTVIYALGTYKDRVLYSDTEVASDYNTYYIDGLPVGPICNPSIETIKAVLYPANTDYLYYVVKNINTGEHFFTSSYSEFLDYKAKYVSNFN